MHRWRTSNDEPGANAALADPASAPAGVPVIASAAHREHQEPLFHSILASPGISPAASDVVSWAMRLARADGARLHTIDFVTARGSTADTEAWLEDARDEAELRLRDLVARADHRDTAVETPRLPDIDVHAEKGDPITGLLNTITELETDLLVIAADDLYRPYSPLIGVLRRGLRKRGLSIMLVRPSETGLLNRIVACVEFSPAAYRAARLALALGQEYAAAVRLLHLYHLPWVELEVIALSSQVDVDMTAIYERDALNRMRNWLPEPVGDWRDPELICRQITNWDYESGIADGIGGEQADLVVLPLPKHVLLAARRDVGTIARLAADVKTSLLIVRHPAAD